MALESTDGSTVKNIRTVVRALEAVLVTARAKPTYALTLHQPWASLILEYGKDVENRTWLPSAALQPGDRLWIHAGQTWDDEGADWAKTLVEVPDEHDCLHGALLGHVRFDGCVTKSDSPWFHGPIGWKLSDPVVIKPILMSGNRKLWKPRV